MGQTIDFSAAINRNNFYCRDIDITGSGNTPGYGYSFGLGISDLRIDTLRMNMAFYLHFDNISGAGYFENLNHYSGQTMTAAVKKSTLSIGIYPLNFSFFKRRLSFSLGGTVGFKIWSQTLGRESSWSSPPTGPWTTKVVDFSDADPNWLITFGIASGLSYNFNLGERWTLAPKYRFCLGLGLDFSRFKSMRHEFGVVLRRKI